jgi:type IV pilus assembly protein PilW
MLKRSVQRGMTLVELMVAMAIGLIISGAMVAIFVSSTKMKQEIDRMGEQIENGRVAMDWLSTDIGLAGFWGTLEYTGMPDPALPNICATNVDDLKAAAPVFIQGIGNVAAAPSCLSDVKPGTDIVVVRRASTCVEGDPACNVLGVGPYFQVSNCTPPADKADGTSGVVALGDELGSPDPVNWYAVSNDPTTLTLHKRDCGNTTAHPPDFPSPPNYASIRRYVAHIYFIANNDRAGDGLPSLKMAELQGTTWVISTIASGIEQLHLEYGQDTSGDTVADTYVAAPGAVTAWRQMVSVKIHLLSRNSSPSPEYQNTSKTYALGGETFGPFSDHIRRHEFSSLVGMRNPVGLRGG